MTIGEERKFVFDYMYNWTVGQEEVYTTSMEPFISTLTDGYNVAGRSIE